MPAEGPGSGRMLLSSVIGVCHTNSPQQFCATSSRHATIIDVRGCCRVGSEQHWLRVDTCSGHRIRQGLWSTFKMNEIELVVCI